MQQQQRAVLQIHHFTPEKNFRQSQKGKLSKMGHSHYEPCMQHDNRRCEYINRISDSHKSSILSSSRQSRLNYAAFYRLLTRLVKKEKKKKVPDIPVMLVFLWQRCNYDKNVPPSGEINSFQMTATWPPEVWLLRCTGTHLIGQEWNWQKCSQEQLWH